MFVIIALFPYYGVYYLYQWYHAKVEKIGNAKFIIISKEDMNLSVFDYRGEQCFHAPIACGKAYGNKRKKGDMKTPEGVFHISTIEDAKGWEHDFQDGNGIIQNAYGDYFIRLAIPNHKGIGIHGTHKPESIGERDTEGCIRLSNENLKKLIPLVSHGMVVIITPSSQDLIENLENTEEEKNKNLRVYQN